MDDMDIETTNDVVGDIAMSLREIRDWLKWTYFAALLIAYALFSLISKVT